MQTEKEARIGRGEEINDSRDCQVLHNVFGQIHVTWIDRYTGDASRNVDTHEKQNKIQGHVLK